MQKIEENKYTAIASKYINNTNKHIFLTGKAGTGKTTFLKNIVHQTHKKTIVSAPTGIAAINAGGVTLHSLFQLPFGTFIPVDEPINGEIYTQVNTPKSVVENIQMNKRKRELIKELELLIIDEVSMLRADLLDCIDLVLRTIRRNRQKFGGLQILFIGDLLQLPPVVRHSEWTFIRKYYNDNFFFEALALRDNKPVHIELQKIYRQSDKVFIDLLNNLREDKITDRDRDLLNSRYNPSFKPANNEGYIFLTTHNQYADNINREELTKLPGKLYTFDAHVQGDFKEYNYPVDFALDLKTGAQVMFIKNDYSGEQRYFNGKIGTVASLGEEYIEVSFEGETETVDVELYTWENKRYTLNQETNEIEEKIVGTFQHFPIRLAWAITIHKSQGLTFQKAIIDLSKAFAPGQIYVALSRLVSLDGLVLTGKIPNESFGVLDSLTTFIESREDETILENIYKKEVLGFVTTSVNQAFNLNYLSNSFYYHLNSYDKQENKSMKQTQKKWFVELQKEVLEIKEIANKFLSQVEKVCNNPGFLERLNERVIAASDYFDPRLKDVSSKINTKREQLKSLKGIKKYSKELQDLDNLLLRQRYLMNKAMALLDSAIKKKELGKSDLQLGNLIEEHRMEPETPVSKSGKKQNAGGAGKEKKKNTREISYELFREGKTVEEIAKDRGYAMSTIEGHLARYVENGKLDVLQFIDESKLQTIMKQFDGKEKINLKEIKDVLGEDFTYTDIKFGLASLKSQSEK